MVARAFAVCVKPLTDVDNRYPSRAMLLLSFRLRGVQSILESLRKPTRNAASGCALALILHVVHNACGSEWWEEVNTRSRVMRFRAVHH